MNKNITTGDTESFYKHLVHSNSLRSELMKTKDPKCVVYNPRLVYNQNRNEQKSKIFSATCKSVRL